MEVAEEFVLFKVGLISLEWPTALYVFFLFLTVTFFLNKLWFKPMLNTLAKREGVREQSMREEKEVADASKKSDEEYRSELLRIQSEVAEARKEADATAAAEAEKILDATKKSAQSKYDAATGTIKTQLDAEIAKTGDLARTLSRTILDKIAA